VDRSHDRSIPEKTVFFVGHLAIVLLGAWFVWMEGMSRLGDVFGMDWRLADILRARLLWGCILLYWIRHAITLGYLLKRKVAWSEVLGLLVFFAFFEIGLLLLGGGVIREEARNMGLPDLLAVLLVLGGSFLNSYSELQRKWWKSRIENQGHCYTQGLFKYSMHINYFGDTLLFGGWCLLSANYWTLLFPLVMGFSFIKFHIPGLDAYLAERYGEEFQEYARRTKHFMPWVY